MPWRQPALRSASGARVGAHPSRGLWPAGSRRFSDRTSGRALVCLLLVDPAFGPRCIGAECQSGQSGRGRVVGVRIKASGPRACGDAAGPNRPPLGPAKNLDCAAPAAQPETLATLPRLVFAAAGPPELASGAPPGAHAPTGRVEHACTAAAKPDFPVQCCEATPLASLGHRPGRVEVPAQEGRGRGCGRTQRSQGVARPLGIFYLVERRWHPGLDWHMLEPQLQPADPLEHRSPRSCWARAPIRNSVLGANVAAGRASAGLWGARLRPTEHQRVFVSEWSRCSEPLRFVIGVLGGAGRTPRWGNCPPQDR